MTDRPGKNGKPGETSPVAAEPLTGVRAPERRVARGPYGEVVVHAEPAPQRDDAPCEDAATVLPTPEGVVLAIADGVGGSRGGAEASRLAIETLHEILAETPTESIREAIMTAFERADAAARASAGVGSTTLLVAEIGQGTLRTYSTGDSEAIVVGGRGKLKLRTVSHSPVGFQLAAGVLDDDEALHHDMRHYISHVVGAGEMRIDVGPSYTLAPHDTIALGSDGLFDNVGIDEVAQIVCRGSLTDAADALVELARRRMRSPAPGEPSKPDDLSLALYRPLRG